jgi:hypothetical protein
MIDRIEKQSAVILMGGVFFLPINLNFEKVNPYVEMHTVCCSKYYCHCVFSLRAIEVWGSRENLIKELLIRDAKRKTYQQSECFIETSVLFPQNVGNMIPSSTCSSLQGNVCHIIIKNILGTSEKITDHKLNS